MKRMDMLCSSQGSTAICSSIDQRSMVRQSHKTLLEQKLQNSPRSSTSSSTMHKILNKPFVPPCSSELLPINPNPKHSFQNSRKSTSFSTHNTTSTNKKSSSESFLGRRRSSADVYDLKKTHPENSSRYLLGETPATFVVDWFPEKKENVVASESLAKAKQFRSLSTNNSINNNNSLPLIRSSSTRSRHQVVVLRVSLHCKGCEGKVKKHLSKMEGVTSYSTDLAAKKVTVIGDVTPLGVLASVSKVKNAQLWPSSSTPWSA